MTRSRIWGFGGRAPASAGRDSKRDSGPLPNARPGSGRADPGEALLLMRSFEESGHGWFWSTDPEGHLTYISDSIAQVLDADRQPLVGSRFAELFVPADDDESGRRPLPFILAKQSAFEKIILCAATAGDGRCWSVSGCPQFDPSGRFTGYRGSAMDVTEQRRTSEHASQLAKYDPLTGLPNRRRMSEVLDAGLAGAEHHRKSCAVMLIDLDRFKQVNDTLGHPAGDILLKQVAERLSRIVGDREKVFRLGGDEFQIVLPNCEDRGIIGDMAADIISTLSQPYSVDGCRCIIGASVGVAIAPADGFSRAELIRNADLALYAAKAGGRGRFRFFSSDLLQAAADKRALEEELRDALARGEISLAYQPIVSAVTNSITGVEALMRWNHPVRGPISPAMFIPIAEEAGLIGPLGDWALRQACEDAVGWPVKLRVAVNVSPIQFKSETLPATVLSALAASGLAPDRLELEITEGVFVGESPSTDAMFASLKEIGVRLALDDFGTGYSSLGYLRTAPFDKIKIDQTFVHAATLPGSRNGAIIAAIVALAEALGMETTAEGIEYMDQLHLIRSLRVSHVQGWVYSKALSCEALARRLEAGDWTIEPSGPTRQRSARQAVYRKVGIIHGNRYRSAIMRNLSESGALIEGVPEFPPESLIVVDFGDGQLVFARITRVAGRQYGIAFEQELVDDGNGGLCTSHRVSAYLLNTLGLPTPGDPDKDMGDPGASEPLEELARKLGLTLAPRPPGHAAPMSLQWSPAAADGPQVPTFRDVAERYLESIGGDEAGRDSARRDLRNHVLPRFGQLRLDQVTEADIIAWLAAKGDGEGLPPGTDRRLHGLLSRMCALAVDLKLPGAELNPLEGSFRFDRRGQGELLLTPAEAERLLEAARAGHNRQLRFILSLLMLTGARPGEILGARWEEIDLAAGTWRLEAPGEARARELRLSAAALALLAEVPRWEGCAWLVPNPATKRPFRSVAGSWEAARGEAGLGHLELDDLRFCDLGSALWEERLLDIALDIADVPGAEAAACRGAEARPAIYGPEPRRSAA
ncbi:MAG TPA: EAL domain-containing protein [Allosphingosinicella sp.]|jgi:diguanylate cyclase (GGDEF)-like protein